MKSTNINDMDTMHIIWHVIYRHRVVLLIASNLLTIVYFIVTKLPAAINTIK